MITSIHHESLYPVIKILQKKRILLQPFSSKVLSKKTLIPCSWALQKMVVYMFYFEQKKQADIAELLGIQRVTVATILRTALKTLRDRYPSF